MSMISFHRANLSGKISQSFRIILFPPRVGSEASARVSTHTRQLQEPMTMFQKQIIAQQPRPTLPAEPHRIDVWCCCDASPALWPAAAYDVLGSLTEQGKVDKRIVELQPQSRL